MTAPPSGRPRRVLVVQGSGEMAGAERMLLALVRNLDPQEVAVSVAVLGSGPFVETLRAVPHVEVVELPPAGRLRQAARVPSSILRLARLIRSRRIEVVQAAGEKMSIYAGWAARFAGVPMVAWLHDAPAGDDDRSGRLVQRAMAATPRRAAVTCSHWMAREFRSRHGIDAVGIDYGLELDRFPAPGAGRSKVRALAGAGEGETVFAYFGRLQHWKGPDVFLDAASRLPRGTAKFLVVGGALYGRDGDYAAALPDQARRLGLGDEVRFLGHRDDALELMSGVDVVVHCSRSPEPFGLVVVEGAALERPVIATRSRGPEEAIEDGVHGFLVAPGDADALAAAMTAMLDGETRRRMGAAGRERVLERFVANRMADDFTRLWSTLR